MRFRELSEAEAKAKIINFLNALTGDLNVNMSEEDLEYIAKRTYEWMGRSNAFTNELLKIHSEIVENYRKYIPFCYASIRTAYKNYKNEY